VGEVAIKSRASFHGYYRNPEATARSYQDGWYFSGDLGYRVGETLFVTGRKSDLIIIGGVNIYPHDVENIAAEHSAVIAGRVAAIGVDDAALGTQRLIVIVESRATDPDVLREIEEHVRSQVPVRLGVNVDRVYHAPYRWLIKTSSGKIARIPNFKRLGELDGARAEA
jgi:acyl-CoA synthetase (AMP-forming)/AMP-acid ligase II